MSELEWTEDDGRILTAEELLPLLEKYFIPPITKVHADWLHQRLVDVVKNPPRWSGECEAYQGIRKYFGTAWQCELSRGITSPRVKDLAMFLACRTKAFPAPKLHCPQPFWGTWREVEGPAPGSMWRLAPTGSAQVVGAEATVGVPRRWYASLYNSPRFPDAPPRKHEFNLLILDTTMEHWGRGHFIKEITADKMVLESPVYLKPDIIRRLEKVSDDDGLPVVWQTVPP